MIIVVGLVIIVAALIVGVAGVLGNGGSAHSVAHFSVLGYHLTGSAGTLFLSGIVVGAVGLLGLSLLLAGARRTSRRGAAARRGLKQSRRETATASQERDDLIEQRDSTTSNLSNGAAPQEAPPSPAGDRWGRLRDLRRGQAPAHTTAQTETSASRVAGDVPVISPDPSVTSTSPALDVHPSASTPAD
jgi:hypothetical protein